MVAGKYVLLLLVIYCKAYNASDSIGGMIGLIGNRLVDLTYCQLRECCNTQAVAINMKELRKSLEKSLFGQHIVMERLIPALEAHLNEKHSRKPLVLCFQGSSGTGKNYVSQKIAEAMYPNGLKSKFVRYYRGRSDFPIANQVDTYNLKINREVRQSLAACGRSLFIFDEVDDMPIGIFSALTSLVEYNTNIDGYDSSKAIFILLSNNGGEQISNRLGNMMKSGTLRGESKMSDFEQILKKAAYNLEGGMRKSSLIEAYLIDHFLPFLPLEKEHVVKCITEEYVRRNMRPTPTDIETILKETAEYDPQHGIFVMSGCKTIAPKVSWYISYNSRKHSMQEL